MVSESLKITSFECVIIEQHKEEMHWGHDKSKETKSLETVQFANIRTNDVEHINSHQNFAPDHLGSGDCVS